MPGRARSMLKGDRLLTVVLPPRLFRSDFDLHGRGSALSAEGSAVACWHACNCSSA